MSGVLCGSCVFLGGSTGGTALVVYPRIRDGVVPLWCTMQLGASDDAGFIYELLL